VDWLTGILFCQVEDICEYCIELYLVHVHALVSLCQISINKCTHILLNHHSINTIHNSNMFQPLKGHLQGILFIHCSSVGQQNESPVVKFWESNITYLQVKV